MKIFYLMGKSSTGKDTIYKELLKNTALNLEQIVPYTTRPIRVGEVNGVDYNFVSEQEFLELKLKNRLIESRTYNTQNGQWTYFTPLMDLADKNYISIGTLESYTSIKKVYGNDLIPIYIELDDGIRLQRALSRERSQKNPKYEEMCRRFLADANDFSEEKLMQNNITVRFENNDLRECTNNIEKYIEEMLS